MVGEVNVPGVYEVLEGTRVFEVIALAVIWVMYFSYNKKISDGSESATSSESSSADNGINVDNDNLIISAIIESNPVVSYIKKNFNRLSFRLNIGNNMYFCSRFK